MHSYWPEYAGQHHGRGSGMEKWPKGWNTAISPLEYPAEFIKDKVLVLTTTNGTRLLHMVQDASVIVIGSFLNLQVLCEFLLAQKKNVLLGCASWKDRFNLEDTLFAGAVVHELQDSFEINCDSARAAMHLYNCSEGNFIEFLKDSSHYRRLSAYGLEQDMAYCATPNLHPVVPYLHGREIVVWKKPFSAEI